MRNILAIIERELRAYFISPVAYVILTIFVFLSGLFFRSILTQVLQMGLMSQIQAQQLGPRLMDMPGMITRGFLSTMSVILFFIILLLTTWIPTGALYLYSSPASGPILTAYLGLLLYGLALVAIGVFISTLTENQIIAAVLSFGTIMVLWLVDVLANNTESATGKEVLSYLSILSHLDDFMKGVLATSHIIFYISLMLVALFLTYRSIDSLRWRG